MSVLLSIDLKTGLVCRYECNPALVRDRVKLTAKVRLCDPGDTVPDFGDPEGRQIIEEFRLTSKIAA